MQFEFTLTPADRDSLKHRLLRAMVPSDGCWEWQRGLEKGYGRLRFKGAVIYAHRASWGVHVGPIPDGLWVLHHCDNRSCINPAHLFLGTNADNVADRDRKKRRTTPARFLNQNGEANIQAKLTAADVVAIRVRYAQGGVSQTALAREFGVSPTSIGRVVRKDLWSHVA